MLSLILQTKFKHTTKKLKTGKITKGYYEQNY